MEWKSLLVSFEGFVEDKRAAEKEALWKERAV